MTQLSDLYGGGSHTIASHSDTTASGSELNTLTDNSIADTLHRHSELVASDGSPDPALSVDGDGKVGIGITTPQNTLHIHKGDSGYTNVQFTNATTGNNTSTDGFRVGLGSNEDGFVMVGEGTDLYLGTDNTTRMTVVSGGWIGVGTGTPEKIFHVKGESQIRGEYANTIDIDNTRTGIKLAHSTTQDMVDGFGVKVVFEIGDDTQILNNIAKISAIRDGADNEGKLVFSAGTNGIEDFMTIGADGNITIVGQLGITGASRMRANRATTQSFASGTGVIVQYNTEVFDNLGEYDNTTNYRFTATKSGYYLAAASLISSYVSWDIGEYWVIAMYKNGTTVSNGFIDIKDRVGVAHCHSTLTDIVYLAADDYIDIRLHHTQGAAVDCNPSAHYNYFAVHRLS